MKKENELIKDIICLKVNLQNDWYPERKQIIEQLNEIIIRNEKRK